jgi:hypothetical protein
MRSRALETTAYIARRCLSEHGFPAPAEFINTLRQASNFRCEDLTFQNLRPPLHDRIS